MGVLGTGVNEARIYDQRGERAIAPLTNASEVKWGRKLNAISQGGVRIQTGGHGDCCSVLGQIGTWGHSLVIFRDGLRVWEGPITRLQYSRAAVVIDAHDVLGWALRKNTVARLVTAPGNFAEAELDFAVQLVFGGFDPAVLAHKQRLAPSTGPLMSLDVKANGGYYADLFAEYARSGAMFTTVGRSIVIWPSTFIMGRTSPLLPHDHMTAEVEVVEDGLMLATGVAAVNDQQVAGTAGGAVDPFYGRVEQVITSAGVEPTTLGANALQYLEQHYPAPLQVNVPAGSVLDCEAPFDITELVCGTIVPVKIAEGLCRSIDSTHQLTAVDVTSGPIGETVAITVAPVSGVLT